MRKKNAEWVFWTTLRSLMSTHPFEMMMKTIEVLVIHARNRAIKNVIVGVTVSSHRII